MQRHFENSGELCEYVSKWNNNYCFMMFSAGIDSIAMYYQLTKYFKKIVPIYLYVIPDLEFVNRYLNYFENVFKRKILKIPHPQTIRLLESSAYNFQHNNQLSSNDLLSVYDMDTCVVYIADAIGYPKNTMCAIGNKATDNPKRFMSIKKYGSANYKRSTFYPIYDWHESDVRNCIRDNNVKIPIDYKIFGRSLDGLMYRFSAPLKKHFPKDYEKIKEFFPLIDVEILRSMI